MKNKRLILLSPSNIEEKEDLLLIANELELNYLLIPKRVFKLKTFSKVLSLIDMILFCVKYKPFIILGTPNFQNRITSYFLGIKYITYMRAIHANSKVLTSFSDYIYKYLNFISNKSFLINNYQADFCIVSSKITKQFLIERGINNNKIIICGPIWLKKYNKLKNGGNKRRLIYITQAYKEHRLYEADKGQKEYVKFLKKISSDLGLELYLKIHPRDKTNYDNCNILKVSPEEFFNIVMIDDVVLSPFSTLAFELMYLGGNIKFVTFKGIDKIYEEIYKKYNIEILKNLNKENLESEFRDYSIFKEIDIKNIKNFL